MLARTISSEPEEESRLLTRLRNLWRPENFHLQHRIGRGGSFFEG